MDYGIDKFYQVDIGAIYGGRICGNGPYGGNSGGRFHISGLINLSRVPYVGLEINRHKDHFFLSTINITEKSFFMQEFGE